MRKFVVASGLIFALLTVAHIWRMIFENRTLATDPWFVWRM